MQPRAVRLVELNVEELEPREMPSASLSVQTFETTTLHSLPAGWLQWSNETGAAFQVTSGSGYGSNDGLVTSGDAKLTARTWINATIQTNVQIQADVYLNNLVPMQLFARGTNLSTATPTYYAVSVTRGMEVDLVRVVNGKTTTLAKLDSLSYLSGEWIQVNFTVQGSQLTVQIFRTDTAEYLAADGAWQIAPTNAISMSDTSIAAAGRVGLARAAGVAGQASVDNFEVNTSPSTTVPTPLVTQNFSGSLVAGLPAGWSSYTNTQGQTFLVSSSATALPGATSVSVTGNSGLVARTWANSALPSDVQVSASLYLNNLATAQIFARGQDLDTDSPDYYAISLTRGATVQLVSVVDGVTNVLGTVATDAWFGQEWVQATLSVIGSTLSVQVYRMDTGEYLTANGLWQVTPTSAIQTTDTSIVGAGDAGIGRVSGYSGSVVFDNFLVVSVPTSATSSGSGTSQLSNINSAPVGPLPSNWSSWTNKGAGAFQVTAPTSTSISNVVASNGTSTAASRAWFNGETYADVQVSASILANGLVPAELFVRGDDLDTSSPSFYAVSVTRGLGIQLLKVINGTTTVLGTISTRTYLSNLWITVGLQANANTLEVVISRQDTGQYLAANGTWQTNQAVAITVSDGALAVGYVGLNRPASYSGQAQFSNLSLVDLDNIAATASPSDPSDTSVPVSTGSAGGTATAAGVEHYSYIRVAELAYYGTPIGTNEVNLLENGVDLVVSNPVYLSEIASVAPSTPQLIYTNVSNIYGSLLTNWLYYAYQNGIDPESAFYHVTQPTPFSGDSASSQPVDWFWSVQVGSNSTGWTNYTSNATETAQNFALGNAGQSLVIGYPDPFNIINLTISQPAANGWTGALQYASSVDANGNPTGWTTLQTITNTTAGFTQNGQITFNPPTAWKMAMINGSDPLYYVRVKTLTNGTVPVIKSILGDDYVNANGGTSGVIPVYDYAADVNHTGYLTAAEYAVAESIGDYARFAYQSRLFYPSYGQMRYATDVSNTQFQQWAIEYNYSFLQANPLADGLFVDNSISKLAVNASAIRESLTNYSTDYGALLAALNQKIAPRWVLANTAGAGTAANALVEDGVSWLEEFGLRPLASNYAQFEDTADLIASRLALSNGKDIAVLDTYPQGGAPTDARTQIAELAEYYLVASPTQTYIMFNGGYAPATAWSQHWTNAVNYNVGQPLGTWSVFATGKDPSNTALTYMVFERKYQNALVLYKPLSYGAGVTGTLDDNTATTQSLGGTYRPLNADGTLGAPITSITLTNGEGAILVKV